MAKTKGLSFRIKNLQSKNAFIVTKNKHPRVLIQIYQEMHRTPNIVMHTIYTNIGLVK